MKTYVDSRTADLARFYQPKALCGGRKQFLILNLSSPTVVAHAGNLFTASDQAAVSAR